MRAAEYAGQFRRDIKRLQKRNVDLTALKALLQLLIEGEVLPGRYRDHALKGPWAGVRDAHVQADLLVLYRLSVGGDSVRFERAGSHSDLFDE